MKQWEPFTMYLTPCSGVAPPAGVGTAFDPWEMVQVYWQLKQRVWENMQVCWCRKDVGRLHQPTV